MPHIFFIDEIISCARKRTKNHELYKCESGLLERKAAASCEFQAFLRIFLALTSLAHILRTAVATRPRFLECKMVVLGTRPVMILLVAFLALLGPAYSFSSSSMTQPRKIRLERRIRLDEHEMRALGGENALQQGNDHTGASSQQVQMAASSNVALTSSELAVPDVTGIAQPFVATAAPAKLDATVPATHSPLPAALPPSAAAQWHVERRRAILTKYPEVHNIVLSCLTVWRNKAVQSLYLASCCC